MTLTQSEINDISSLVLKKIKEKYLLVEKSFNLETHTQKYKSEQKEIEQVFIDNITNIACAYFGIEKETVKTAKRQKKIFNDVTNIIAHLCKDLPEKPISQASIGHYFSKDHSVIFHWQKMALHKMTNDFEFKSDLNEIKKLVEQSLKIY